MNRHIILLCLFLLTACSHREPSNIIRVGTIAGPETELMQSAKKVALQRYNLKIDIVTFNDFILPNQALHDADIDANAFQHTPYLNAQNTAQHYHLIPVAKTFLYPMALYSHKIEQLNELRDGSQIAIPNDPSNETRALLLLQSSKLITLHQTSAFLTPKDIIRNPKKIRFITLDAAELPRALADTTAAVINTTFAKPAGLKTKNSLLTESTHSPYCNVIATRQSLAHSIKIRELIRAYQSRAVLKRAKQLFGDRAIPGFKVKDID